MARGTARGSVRFLHLLRIDTVQTKLKYNDLQKLYHAEILKLAQTAEERYRQNMGCERLYLCGRKNVSGQYWAEFRIMSGYENDWQNEFEYVHGKPIPIHIPYSLYFDWIKTILKSE